MLALYQRDEAAAIAWLTRAAARAQATHDQRTEARALSSLGVAHMQLGDLTRARASLEESLTILRALDD